MSYGEILGLNMIWENKNLFLLNTEVRHWKFQGQFREDFFPQKAVYKLGRYGPYLVFWTYVPFGKAAMKPPRPPSTLASATAEIMRKGTILCIFIKKPFSSNLSLSGKFVTVPKRYLEQLSSSNSSFNERKLLTCCGLSFPRKQYENKKVFQ